jgi:hypothetical protein
VLTGASAVALTNKTSSLSTRLSRPSHESSRTFKTSVTPSTPRRPWERQVFVVGREVEVVGTAVAEVEAGPSEVATAVSNDLVPYLLSRIFRVVGGGNSNPVPWDLDNPASRLPQSVSSVLRRLSSCFLSFVYIDINCLFQSPDSRFRSNLRVRIIRLRCATPHDSVSEGLPSSENGRGVLLSTLHYDSEACVKRH